MKNSWASLISKAIALPLAFVCLSLTAQPVFAATYHFTRVTNNATDISQQLAVEITESMGGALFTFTNNVGIDSSLTEIYFDMGTTSLFSNISVFADSGDGVAFDNSPSPVNLPGGEGIDFMTHYGGDAIGPMKNGVNTADEWVSFFGVYDTGSYAGLLSALALGDFRIGLHVQGIGGSDGDSEGYVNTVPLPAAAWLFGSALLGLGAIARRRKA